VITDALGRTFTFPRPPARVVSLVPSLTETLFDLGAGESVIAISDFCIFPPIENLPRVGGTKNPNVNEIRALAPDLVHMNLEENLKRHADAIEQFAPVFVSEPKTVDDVAAQIATLGSIHACEERARQLVAELRHEQAAIRVNRFSFACAIWKKPWMWCGPDTYVSNLVGAAGGTNVINETRYPVRELESVRADMIFLPDEPYLFTEDDAQLARELTGARVVGPFPGHLFTWHGTRTIRGLRFLSGLWPE
jgi:ABC-type Fe3+-hydroxamate transport system substrate-binding protein